MAMPCSEIMFYKRALHKYVHRLSIYAFIHVKNYFLKDTNQTWHWFCKTIFFNGA